MTFSVGCVLFQVFATEQKDADFAFGYGAGWRPPARTRPSTDFQIAPSSTPLRWPPRAVFSARDREALAGRLRQGVFRPALSAPSGVNNLPGDQRVTLRTRGPACGDVLWPVPAVRDEQGDVRLLQRGSTGPAWSVPPVRHGRTSPGPGLRTVWSSLH